METSSAATGAADDRILQAPAVPVPQAPPARKSSPAVPGQVLVVDDDPEMCKVLELGLSSKGHAVSTALSVKDALALLGQSAYDVLIADLQLGDGSGLELCQRGHELHPDLPVIVITAFGSMEAAVGAVRAGAYDFVSKPVDVEAVALMVERGVRHRRLCGEVLRLRAEVASHATRPFGILGESAVIRKVLDLIDRVASSEAAVLITGPSGTGKELVARTLHGRSQRCDEPFVAINCAALPSELLESELFGHVRGAFTDAKAARRGLFVEASAGTLLLDEIGELPMELQPKLLRALQERTVRPVGSDQEVPFTARVVAATNRDLEQDVEEGRFREDLYYRINVIHIAVPPLNARGGDVLLLAQQFLRTVVERENKPVRGFMPAAAAKLLDYDWPGNVRELENAVERAVALARYDTITVDDLPERIRDYQSQKIVIADSTENVLTLEQLERRYIHQILKAVEGNKTRAAQLLGVDRRTLYRKLERYDAPRRP